MVGELGLVTTLLIGLAIGVVGYTILAFWIGLFWKDFEHSNWYMRLFYAHIILWIVAVCSISLEWLDKTFDVWGKPTLIFFMVSLVLMGISKISKLK